MEKIGEKQNKKPVHRGVDGHGWRGMEDLDAWGRCQRSVWLEGDFWPFWLFWLRC